VGAIVGPYRVEAFIARGAVGAVFRARHGETGALVAVKVLTAASAPRQRKRFVREAQLLAKLKIPGIVQVFEFGDEEYLSWMSMELVDGETLEAWLRKPVAVGRAVEMLMQMSRALAGVHAAGVVHRDLKPSNILIGPDGRPVVSDFGVARDLNERSSLTKTGASVGTPLYMAPEQTRGQTPSPATDVHALGVILYEALTGHVPWVNEDVGLLGIMTAIQRDTPRKPSAADPRVPSALDRVCLKALAKTAEGRYADAGEFADALEDFLEGSAAESRGALPVVRVLVAGLVVALIGIATLWSSGSEGGAGVEPLPDVVSTPLPDSPEPAEPPLADPPVPDEPLEPRRFEVQPGPVYGVDTFVRNDGLYMNDNAGAKPWLTVGDRNERGQRGDFRVLIRFDVSDVAQAAQVERATLSLRATALKSFKSPLRIVVQPLVATRNASGQGAEQTPWVEGASGWDDTLDGVCWVGALPGQRIPQVDSGMPQFTQPNVERERDYGRGAPGVLDVAIVDGEGWVALDVTAAVQDWVRDPSGNLGLRVSHAPEGKPWRDGRLSFASSDHPEARWRPRLRIEYRDPSGR
jgi:predicted Ser/Thr protein kinase